VLKEKVFGVFFFCFQYLEIPPLYCRLFIILQVIFQVAGEACGSYI